jgi:hypothetical protein
MPDKDWCQGSCAPRRDCAKSWLTSKGNWNAVKFDRAVVRKRQPPARPIEHQRHQQMSVAGQKTKCRNSQRGFA